MTTNNQPSSFRDQLKSILDELQNMAATDDLSNDWGGQLKESEQAICDLIARTVIGEDVEVPRPLDEESRARFYRRSGQNFIRQQQRRILTAEGDK